MKRSVFAKGKIHADRAAFCLLHLDLEFAARLKWLQITSERYFTLGLQIACSFLKTKVIAVQAFLETKVPAVSNMMCCFRLYWTGHKATTVCIPSILSQQNPIGWKHGLWVCIASIQLRLSVADDTIARTENALPPYQTNGCRVNILFRVDTTHYYDRVMIASLLFNTIMTLPAI